ncbi:MAG: DUF4238 domain-containing protein [Ignavibacteria bacterium]|nr:DUF4238 domain-containing protein [Ignavibacteria bacterium]
MPEYKKQHIIAENYLKGFSLVDYYKNNKANCPVWIYNLKEQTLKFKSPNNIAWRPYYYSYIDKNGDYEHYLEKEFSKLESMTNILIRKIDTNIRNIRQNREIPILTEEDRVLLVHFIFWHMKKIPSVVDWIYDEVKNAYTEISKRHNNTFRESMIKNRTLELMMNMGTGKEFDFVKVLLQKDFRIAFLSNDKSSFITTDNPVVRFNKTSTDGIGIESTEIYFPINQRCLILLHGVGNKFEYLRLSDRKLLYKQNRFMALKAKYFIISRDKEYLIKILKDLKYEIKDKSSEVFSSQVKSRIHTV